MATKVRSFKHPYIKLLYPQQAAFFPYSNSVLVEDEVTVLIDLGTGRSVIEALEPRVDLVLLTHSHYDHIHGWPLFNDGRCLVGQEERALFERDEAYKDANALQRWRELMGHETELHWRAGHNRILNNPETVAPLGMPEVKIRDTFHHGQRFDCGHVQFYAVLLAGHSPGHYGFYFPEEDFLFSSDYDLAPTGPWFGSEYSDYGAILASIEHILELKPGKLFASHRHKVFDRAELPRQFDRYLEIPRRRMELALKALDRPMSILELAQTPGLCFAVNKDDPYQIFWDRIMLLKQLEYLQTQNEIKKSPEGLFFKA